MIGTHVPDLGLEAYVAGEAQAQEVRLSDYRGSWVVLFFYPRDFTFICPTELQAFGNLQVDFADQEAVIVAASTDSYWSHKAWFQTHPMLTRVTYPVLADTAHQLSEAFGVLLEDGSALRGTFVIDPEGVIRSVAIVDQNVGRSPDETLRIVQALRTGELCPVNWKPGEETVRLAA
jgi:alkyl hydroperoxide reductase subunit AhpC